MRKGPPRKSADRKRTRLLRVLLTVSEWRTLEAKALDMGVGVSTVVRLALADKL